MDRSLLVAESVKKSPKCEHTQWGSVSSSGTGDRGGGIALVVNDNTQDVEFERHSTTQVGAVIHVRGNSWQCTAHDKRTKPPHPCNR